MKQQFFCDCLNQDLGQSEIALGEIGILFHSGINRDPISQLKNRDLISQWKNWDPISQWKNRDPFSQWKIGILSPNGKIEILTCEKYHG